ncbi:MAG: hypothetical protein JOZ77_02980 [Candidatus Eremiobacteraeota bacterium]|nr:hypothetical protein [Candidatus Eremiobacteraeota bacterium]
MSAARVVLSVARADFFERSRRYQYLATLVVTLVAGIFFVPPRGANYVAFTVDGYRGIYNSAWMGAMMAMLATTALSLFGFYLVKSAIAVDRATRVGEIVASTRASRLEYIGGKWLGNVAVLTSLTLLLMADAVIMQLVRGEDRTIDLIAIASPFLVVLLPVILLVSAVAVLFEAIQFLRGGAGNVTYFFLWIAGLSLGAAPASKIPSPWNDPLGIMAVGQQINGALAKIAPHIHKDVDLLLGGSRSTERYFVWHGFAWSAADVAGRLIWCLVAFAIVVLAARLFDRFADGAQPTRERAAKPWQSALARTAERVSAPIFDRLFAGDFGALVLAELRLMLKGSNIWWYVVAIGLWIATLVSPATAQSALLDLAWLWPILKWSQIGTRECAFNTEGFVFPSLQPLRRQYVAMWISGIALALLMGSGSIVHWLIAADWIAVAAVVAGAVFVPTLALACGAISGTSRLFEIVYLVLWYVGPMNNVPDLDFTRPSGVPMAMTATVVLAVVAFAMRRIRLRSA